MKKILIVDDNKMVLKSEEISFTKDGFVVEAYENSPEALKNFKDHHEIIGVIITDYLMPDINGLDLIKEIRKIDPNMNIILCSSYIDKQLEEELKVLSCLIFLKPTNLNEIKIKLHEFLDK